MMVALSVPDQLDRWATDLAPHLSIVGVGLLLFFLIEGRMLQDGVRKAQVKEPKYFPAFLAAIISIPLCIAIALALSFIPLLGWIAGLLLSFALVGGLCALFFGCTWGQGFYAAFWWWLYHLIFVLVVGGILIALGIAFGVALAKR